MASGFIIQRREIHILRVQAKPKEPLSRAQKIKRSESGYRTTSGNIAAVDFGTTSVTLAYTTRGDKETNTLVLDKANMDHRVPNAILLGKKDSSFSVTSFGRDAQSAFTRMRPDDRSNHVYFERIKMLMKKEKNISRESHVESFTGEKFFLVEVVAYILKYLKDALMEHLANTAAKPLKAQDFDWVITVPAIWDARGKRMMREAAYLAGLTSGAPGLNHLTPVRPGTILACPDDVNPDKLSLALEPEVAAIYSQRAVAKEVIEAGSPRFLKPEGAYLVLDIGGGTVDITAQAEVAGGIEVLSIPMGNDWGGTRVNEQFSELFEGIVGDRKFLRYLSSGDRVRRQAILNKLFYHEFELEKITFGDGKQAGNEMSIEVPRDIIEFYGEEKIEAGTLKIPGVEFANDSLYLSMQVVEENLFGPPVKGIIEAMLTILDDLDQRIDTFYLVGGFGGCKYLYTKVGEEIKKKFGKTDCRIIVPKNPRLAIASGAVMWRKDPDAIKSRRVDATYGITIRMPFDDNKHDPHYRVYNEEQKCYQCDNVFQVFLQRGEIAQSDEVLTSDLVPSYQSTQKMQFIIWSTPMLGVQYIKDKEGKANVEKIGELVINIPNPDNLPRSKRIVTVQMDFSGTEIQARAKYKVTGEEVKTVCDFLSAQAP